MSTVISSFNTSNRCTILSLLYILVMHGKIIKLPISNLVRLYACTFLVIIVIVIKSQVNTVVFLFEIVMDRNNYYNERMNSGGARGGGGGRGGVTPRIWPLPQLEVFLPTCHPTLEIMV